MKAKQANFLKNEPSIQQNEEENKNSAEKE